MTPGVNEDVYIASGGQGVAQRVIMAKRRDIFAKLRELVDFGEISKALDVGVTADKTMSSSNFFEIFYPDKSHITALSDQDASWLETSYPGLRFVKGDGREMPFEDRSFDLVFSSATLEHVGSAEKQQLFLNECCRVSRKYVFLTTPNRWHPIEFHTVLPFLHWLPKNCWRKLLARGGAIKTK